MSNITLIVPVHKLEEELLGRCIESIKNQRVKPYEVLFVTSDDDSVNDYLNNFDFGDLKDVTRVVKNDSGEYDFQSQINYGVNESKGEYFTFLEYDDELSHIWIKNGVEYINAYPEVGVFLPIVYETDNNGNFISFTNESVWSKNFTEELGYLDNNTLQKVQNFNFDGMIVNKEKFIEGGMLKKHMK